MSELVSLAFIVQKQPTFLGINLLSIFEIVIFE